MPKVVGSNPITVYWIDIFSHLFVVKIVMFFVKTKINEKDAGVGPFKKTFQKHFKNTILYIFTAFKNVNGKRDVRFS